MVRLTIDIERPLTDDLADDLEYIADLLRQGYRSGVDPSWDTTGYEELDDTEEAL